MEVLIIQPLSSGAKIPESGLVPADAHLWREAQVQRQSGCVDSRCLPLIHTTWQRGMAHEQRHVFHGYVIGGFVTDSKLAMRLAQGWNRLTGGAGAPRLIALSFDDPPPVDEVAAAFLALGPATSPDAL